MTTTMETATRGPAAHEASGQTPYTRRARYFDSGNAFNIVYPDVPAATFVAERDAALDPATGTALIHCDQSAAMGLPFPATSPLVLASYARVRAGESLRIDVRATVVLAYVIDGPGRAVQGTDTIEWSTGDVFCLPGGQPIQLVSPERDCVLWLVTNEPELALERVLPPAPGDGAGRGCTFPASTIAEELVHARAKLAGQRVAGLAVVFATERLEARKNISPSLTLAMNQLDAGGAQAAHRHNAVAVSLAIEGKHCYSMVGGVRKDWARYVTMVTPPAERPLAPQRGQGPGELVDRPGRRPLLPLPHHGVSVRRSGREQLREGSEAKPLSHGAMAVAYAHSHVIQARDLMPYATTDDGVRLYYEEAGSGQPLVFVHEFAGDHRSWEPQMRFFSRHFHCVAFSARGYPPSDVPPADRYSQARARDDIIAIMDHLRFDRAHVVGLSMGGFATLHVGIGHPKRARSLVVAGCGYGAQPGQKEKFVAECELAAAAIERDGMAKAAETYAIGPSRVQFQNKDPRGWQVFAAQLREHSTEGSARTLRGLQMRRPSLWELVDEMKRIDVPTLDLDRRRGRAVPRARAADETGDPDLGAGGSAARGAHAQSRRPGRLQSRGVRLHLRGRAGALGQARSAVGRSRDSRVYALARGAARRSELAICRAASTR